jgi:hypothetical protein
MSEGGRPGGLTAMAVINFVFAVFAFLSVFSYVWMALGMPMAPENSGMREAKEMVDRVPKGAWVALAALAVLVTMALIVSGVGYLRQRRVAGRGWGTAYALLALVAFGVEVTFMPEKVRLVSLAGLVYPVLTLILLHTTFRHDLVR